MAVRGCAKGSAQQVTGAQGSGEALVSLLLYHYNYFYYDDCCSQD